MAKKKSLNLNSPLVSIIIPVYNSEKYLAETINSALKQTWDNLEVIIIDDGSKDNSKVIAKSFESCKVKIFEQENRGASAARNKGLKEAQGEFIQFLDADDLLSPKKIEAQIQALKSRSEFLSFTNTDSFSDGIIEPDIRKPQNELKYYHDPIDFIIKMFYRGSPQDNHFGMIQTNAWLTHRSIIDKAGFWNESLSVNDDGEFFCRVMLNCEGLIYVDKEEAINYYRIPANALGLSSRTDLTGMKSILLSTELIYRHIKAVTQDMRLDIGFAKTFREIGVKFYPRYMSLYKISENWVKLLGGTDFVPPIGGKFLEKVKDIFGWKFARILQTAKWYFIK